MTRPGRGFRITSIVMGVLFVLSALVQLNDPDPLRWIVLYVVAAALPFAAASITLSPRWPALSPMTTSRRASGSIAPRATAPTAA